MRERWTKRADVEKERRENDRGGKERKGIRGRIEEEGKRKRDKV